MTNETRMSEYVTRGEMHEALAIWAGAIVDRVLQGLEPKFEAIDKRFEAIDKRFEAIDKRFEAIEAKFEAMFDEFQGRLVLLESRVAEIPALFRTMELSILASVQSMLEPQRTVPERLGEIEAAALPERVLKLEAKVFAPRRRASKTSRKRQG